VLCPQCQSTRIVGGRGELGEGTKKSGRRGCGLGEAMGIRLKDTTAFDQLSFNSHLRNKPAFNSI